MFGCDVCPWNRFSKPHNEKYFTPLLQVLNFSTTDWEELTEESFKQVFKNSPLKMANDRVDLQNKTSSGIIQNSVWPVINKGYYSIGDNAKKLHK